MNRPRLPTLFISHGGGPWPYIDEMRRTFARTEAALAALPARLPAPPRAVLVVSGHWEAPAFTVATSPRPSTVYDYSGFPEHTYRIQYPAPGEPELAGRVRGLLEGAGLAVAEDPRRGFDHGVFVPLGLMWPNADVPVLMLSIRSDYDPEAHIAAGAALFSLREEGVLILGSGLTYHDLRRFGPEGGPVSQAFEAWLADAVGRNEAERNRLLTAWEQAPGARRAHPREDHLLPLLVAAGAARDSLGERLFLEQAYGITMGSYWFGDR